MGAGTGRTVDRSGGLAGRYASRQMDITMTGEFFMVDASEVPNIQQQMRDRYMAFH
jgi:hypothetical protein